ncbi:MAG: EpsG family protein, partial [Eubacterium sp.]
LISVIQCLGMTAFYSRYSVNFNHSIFLFYTTGCFLWTVNGMRQFLAASIILMFSHFLLERKTIPFIIVVIIASTIHNSALIMIPTYFCINYKPWSKKSNAFVVIVMALLIIYVFGFSSNDSDYSYITSDEYAGVNIFRVIVMSIPALLAFVKRKEIAEIAPLEINILINLSIICCGCFIFGAFTNGMVARIALYFQVYTYVLLPWILNIFEEDRKKTITWTINILLIAYFCYDMFVAGNGVYQSSNLRIF